MKSFSPRAVILIAMMALGTPLSGSDGKEGAEDATTALESFLSRRKASVVGMVGFYGQPRPPQWLILEKCPPEGETQLWRESVVSAGKIRAERTFRRLPGQDIPDLPFSREDLVVSSDQAFRIAETEAKREKVSFESVHFLLRCRDKASEPIWTIDLVDRFQNTVGIVYLSARDGRVMRTSWGGRLEGRVTSAQ